MPAVDVKRYIQELKLSEAHTAVYKLAALALAYRDALKKEIEDQGIRDNDKYLHTLDAAALAKAEEVR